MFKDYPLTPEKINTQKEWLSSYCLKIANEQNSITGTVKKLVTTLMGKNNYVIHYRNLQLYLELGMKLKKIHRILKFKQIDWMESFTDFNTDKRKKLSNESERFFKMNKYCCIWKNYGKYGKKSETKNFKKLKKKFVSINQNLHASDGIYMIKN